MISEREAADYPFLRGASELVKILYPRGDDLASPRYARVLDRGEERIAEAILEGVVGERASGDIASRPVDDGFTPAIIDVLSFPVALMFVTAVDDFYLARRFALAEARRVHGLLRREREARVALMGRDEFGWRMRPVQREVDGQAYGFELHFVDYLRNASSFREDKWKLVNRLMGSGYVLLTSAEAARLLQVEVERLVLDLVTRHGKISLPEAHRERVGRIAKLFEEHRAGISGEALPAEVLVNAFPPCMRRAFEGLTSGRRASHMERFALSSFLVNSGMDLDRIVRLFVSVTDFDERLTRYQIEHIAGLRGGRTRYTPPSCSTLRTHSVCHNPDDLCRRINHPLSYYRSRVRDLEGAGGEEGAEGE